MPPRIMIVSDCRFQHSPMFGQDALSQTVCRPSSATRFLRSKKTSPPASSSGSRAASAGTAGARRREAPPFRLEDAQAARTGFDDTGRHFGWWNLPPGSMLRWAGSCGGGQAGWGRSSSSRQCSPSGRAPAPLLAPEARTRGASPGKPRRRFALGRYGEAAAKYEAAFALRPDPALLYNAAQSHRLGGQQAARARALPELRPPLSRRCQRGGRPRSRLGAEEGRRGPAAPATGQPRRRRLRAAPAPPDAETRPPSFETAAPAAPPPVATTPPSPRTNTSVPLLSRPAPAPAEAKPSLTQQTWFWVAVGAAVAVVGTTVILLASRGETFPEPTFGTARGN